MIKMKKSDKKVFKALFLSFILFFVFVGIANIATAQNTSNNQKKVYFFYGEGCPHCENVIDSGILEEVAKIENVEVLKLEVYFNQTNREIYIDFAEKLRIPSIQRGVPLVIIEYCDKGYSYFIGDKPIINNLIEAATTCEPMKKISTSVSSDKPYSKELTLGGIIIAALIDSINPCAFGVLIFLIATMLSMASKKKAFKYGFVYIFVVFLVYFSAGLGILKIISEFYNILNYMVVVAGALIFVAGLIEIKDFFKYGEGFSLRIPVSIKPLLEKITQKGTLWAVIILGVIVALVELPCTGGIYLAILSLMHINKTFGISYLVLYNLIFVLPLVFIVFLTYRGMKTEKMTNWIDKNKRWMRLAAGIVMIALAMYLLNSVYNLI